MAKELSMGWNGVRFGLILVQWAAIVTGYLFMLNAAIMFALAPSVVGQQFFMYAGFGLLLLLASLFLSLLRRAVHIDSDTLREQIIFVGIFLFSWLLTVTYPAPADLVLGALSQATPLILFAAACLALLGLLCCLTAIGNPTNWLIAASAFCVTSAAVLMLLHLAQPAWVDLIIPEAMKESLLFKRPKITGVGLGCVGILLHGIYLRRVADYFHDNSTSEFVTGYLGYHLFASVGLVAGLMLFSNHQMQLVAQIGGVTLDTISVLWSAVSSLLVAIGSIWLGRCVGGSRSVIDLSRRR